MPGPSAGQLFKPKVGSCFQAHDCHLHFEQIDERQEQRAVEAVLL